MLIFVLVLVLVLWLVLAFVLAYMLALVLTLELVLVASASSWHLAASGLAASGSIWDHLCHLGSSGSIWEHLASSGGIWQHLSWQHLAASGILRHHLAASGSIWHHLGCLAERSKLCRLEIEPWAGNQALVARIKDFGGFPTSEDTFIFVGGPGCVQNVKI